MDAICFISLKYILSKKKLNVIKHELSLFTDLNKHPKKYEYIPEI